jgi:hypothetical protein
MIPMLLDTHDSICGNQHGKTRWERTSSPLPPKPLSMEVARIWRGPLSADAPCRQSVEMNLPVFIESGI